MNFATGIIICRSRWVFLTVMCVWIFSGTGNCAEPSSAPSNSSAISAPDAGAGQQRAPDSGIYGAMVAAWGNAPSNPPTYECIKVFDAAGSKLIATGKCSGIFATFRVPLPPGRYIIDKGFTVQRTPPSGPQPGSFAVDIAPGQWVHLAPKAPPGPVP